MASGSCSPRIEEAGRNCIYRRADGSGAAERLFPITEGTELHPGAHMVARRHDAPLLRRPRHRHRGDGRRAQGRATHPKSIPRRARPPCRRTVAGWRTCRTCPVNAEVYVERFPQLGDRQKISANGGVKPRWSRDGRTLYYISADGTSFFSVPVSIQSATDRRCPEAPVRGNIPQGLGRHTAVRRDT